MAARGKQKLSAELSSAAARWAQWRRTRVLGTRIPESLWNSALELAARHGVSKTAIALGGDYYALRKRLDAQSPPRRVGATAAPAPAFVELAPPSPATAGGCVIEFEKASGAKMRIELPASQGLDLAALGRSFWESR
ncbi:MAG TPA: hypothetical protein VFU81_16120 [Thermomicrobiales bacterium]|nr:hypothetical protein [Thermomicrobiales bacterium]